MELIKRDDRFDLYNEDGHKIASTLKGCVNKLSLKNCQEIENGYDLNELAKEKYPYEKTEMFSCFELDCKQEGFIEGAKTILEILGDKKFTINEVVELCKILMSNPFETCGKTYQELTDNYIQSLKQTEWDVEIVTHAKENGSYTKEDGFEQEQELDKDGCLILKRKI